MEQHGMPMSMQKDTEQTTHLSLLLLRDRLSFRLSRDRDLLRLRSLDLDLLLLLRSLERDLLRPMAKQAS
jgi:hypothetical protein